MRKVLGIVVGYFLMIGGLSALASMAIDMIFDGHNPHVVHLLIAGTCSGIGTFMFFFSFNSGKHQ